MIGRARGGAVAPEVEVVVGVHHVDEVEARVLLGELIQGLSIKARGGEPEVIADGCTCREVSFVDVDA